MIKTKEVTDLLRDIPKIYLMFFAFAVIIMFLTIWYVNTFQKDTETLQLNDVVLSATLSDIDQTSRIYDSPGVLLLADSFETTVWERLEETYGEGAIVVFDYMFDYEDARFGLEEADAKGSSISYKIGTDDKPEVGNVDQSSVYTGRPVKAVRVKIRNVGDKVGDWTYTATVVVDVANP